MANGHRAGASARRPSTGPRPGSRARGEERPRADIRVRVLDGASAGTEYAIQGSVIRLGRAEDNDIVLPDSNASRNHAELVREPSGRYVVRDLGSRNGILVNRRKVPKAVLGNGDRVTIGSTTIEFVSPDQPSTGSPAVRWLAVAGAAGLLGFAVISFAGGGNGDAAPDGPIVVVPSDSSPLPSGTGVVRPPVVTGDGVSIAELFATSQVAPPGTQKGSEVGRNKDTKPDPLAVTPLPRGPANEKLVATIMQDGERAYQGGRLVPARDSFERAMKLDPSCERCASRFDVVDKQIKKEITDAMTAGLSYMETERFDQAINMFERVKFLEPDPGSINNATATAQIAEATKRKTERGR